MYFDYIIPGIPIPLKRPRTSRGRFYDPQCKEKEAIQLYLKLSEKAICIEDSPISLQLGFFLPIPASWSLKKQTAALLQPHTKKPDLDNLVKFLLDLGNKVLWKDDSLIYKLDASKLYCNNPRTELKMWTK